MDFKRQVLVVLTLNVCLLGLKGQKKDVELGMTDRTGIHVTKEILK